MKPIYSSKLYSRTNILVWSPSSLELLAQGASVEEAKRRVEFSGPRWQRHYIYKPSAAYFRKLNKMTQHFKTPSIL